MSSLQIKNSLHVCSFKSFQIDEIESGETTTPLKIKSVDSAAATAATAAGKKKAEEIGPSVVGWVSSGGFI